MNKVFILISVMIGIFMSFNAFAGYEEGQIWRYKTRPGEEQSLLYIVKIDEVQGFGKIYHIYIDGLKIKSPHTATKIQNHLPHAPVDETTLNESVTQQFNGSKPIPDISEGYKAWKEPFDKGEAGVFNIPVKKIIEYIEKVINNECRTALTADRENDAIFSFYTVSIKRVICESCGRFPVRSRRAIDFKEYG